VTDGAGDLGKAGYEEVVGQFLDTADGQLGALAAERARELAVVRVLLVGRLGVDVVVDALFTERVQTRQTLGVAIRVETDLAHQELVVYLLSQTHPATDHRCRRRRHSNATCSSSSSSSSWTWRSFSGLQPDRQTDRHISVHRQFHRDCSDVSTSTLQAESSDAHQRICR